jgi:hypothetical protein
VLSGCGSSLHQAVKTNDPSHVASLLREGANPNEVADGLTPLMRAASLGQRELIPVLLDNGGDIEAATGTGWRPLHFAINAGQTDIALLLLTRGANIQALTADGNSPLHFAARKGNLGLVRELLTRGAPVNVKNTEGWTPLLVAAGQEFEATAQVLLEYKAAIEAVTSSKEGQFATASVYKFAAQLVEGQANRPQAIEYYHTAATHFDHAETQYQTAAQELTKKLENDVTPSVLRTIGVIALQALAQTAANYQARQQGKQFAQIAALKHASSTGTGLNGYYGALQQYKPLYSSAGVTPPLAVSAPSPGSEATTANIRDTYARLAEKSRTNARKCRDILGCYVNGGSEDKLVACLKTAQAS